MARIPSTCLIWLNDRSVPRNVVVRAGGPDRESLIGSVVGAPVRGYVR